MINLLPPGQKEELKQEESFKLALIFGIIVLAFLVSLSLILFSLKTFILSDCRVQEIYLEQKKKEIEDAELQEVEEKIKKYNLILSKLEDFYQGQPDLVLILEKISRSFPEGTYLIKLDFDPQTYQISLDGFSSTREVLIQFKENLERIEGFKDVEFLPASWVYLTDIKFSVNFKVE